MKYKINKRITAERLDEILRIKDTRGLTAENLVEVARNPRNPLHEIFEWNNTKAGHEFRLYQARVLINEVKIEVGDKEVFAFESVSLSVGKPNKEDRVYKGFEEIIANEDLKKQILSRALQSLIYWKAQYHSYKELTPIFQAIDKVQTKIKPTGAKQNENKKIKNRDKTRRN